MNYPDGHGVHEQTPIDEELWSLKVVMAKTGLSRSTLYGYIAVGAFPTQRRLGKRRVAWFASEVRNWNCESAGRGKGNSEPTSPRMTPPSACDRPHNSNEKRGPRRAGVTARRAEAS
jgi:prophage regulatory protein